MKNDKIQVYGWLREAQKDLSRARANAPDIVKVVGKLLDQARSFTLPAYTVTDPPYKGYLYESEESLSTIEKYRQPFPVIALQFPILDDRDPKIRVPTVAVLSHDEQNSKLTVVVASKLNGQTNWSWAPAGLTVNIEGSVSLNGMAIKPFTFGGPPLNKEQSQMLVNHSNPALMAAYEMSVLIQCQNISIKKVEPPVSVNEKRKRRGKRLLPTGYVLTVKRENTRYESTSSRKTNGDDIKNRRTHFRRGHIRTIQSGKRVWVSPAIVNPGRTVLDSSYNVIF